MTGSILLFVCIGTLISLLAFSALASPLIKERQGMDGFEILVLGVMVLVTGLMGLLGIYVLVEVM